MKGPPKSYFLFLLLKHVIEDRHDPVFEVAVVVVGNNEVSSAVQALQTEVTAVQIELADVELAHAFDEVLLDSSARCDNHIHQMVLHQVVNDLSHTAAHHVAGVRKEDRALLVLSEFRVAPLVRLIRQGSVVRKSPVKLRGQGRSKNNTMRLISSMAADMFVAWNPIVA